MTDSPQGLLTIGRWIRDRAVVTPDRTAIDFDGPDGWETTTYEQLDTRSERLAATLLAEGLDRGQVVATLTPNRPEHVELMFACAKAGLVLAPFNWRFAPAEVAYLIDNSEPPVLFVHPDHDELADKALEEADSSPRRIPLTREALDDLCGGVEGGSHARDATVEDDDPLLLIYTSGTTGKPKGAQLTHANCFWTNLSLDRTVDVTTADTVLQVLPQFHVGGWNVQPLLAWWKGATVVLEPGFKAGRVLGLLEEKGVTTMMGVPANYLFMAEQDEFADVDLSSLRQAVVGGAPMPESLLKTWHERGVDIVQGYGLTEASPNVLCLPPEHASRKLGYAGKPYPHVEVALRDVDSGELLQGAAEGELLVRGPNVFPGYWRNEEATREVFVDGWLRTEDIVERDDEGFYKIQDRLKDMFVSGGENVYPAEIEQVLTDHPDVVEAAVVGVSDERWGEVGVAFVVVRDDGSAEEDELLDLCKDRLAKYKVPKDVRYLDELPRNSMNKVEKDQLRERYRSEGESGDG